MANAHDFHPSILRAYDIRGVVGETLSAADARAIGRAFATLVARRRAGRRICVGFDGRLSSPELEAALVEGLADGGADVLRIGLGPTPMLYFAVFDLAADAGVMITGSHNPPDHNGIKLMMGRASFFGDDIIELGRVAAAGDYVDREGTVSECPVLDAYLARLAADFAGERPLKVAWDAGNGAGGEAMARLAARLPGRHVLLNETIDGRFPAHHPDPTVAANLAQIIAAVKAERCDLGIALDGDGDRIGVVDGRGRIMWGDQLLAILAADVLGRRPGATIIADVKSSDVLFDEIARLGGKPLMWRTGRTSIESKMAETGAPLGGEMVGHVFFADGYYGFDDGLYAAVRLLSIVARGDKSLAALGDRLPAMVNTPEVRIACGDERKFAVVEEIAARLRAAGVAFNDLDGVRVRSDDGWWLLRASNTQAALVVRCEARDESGLDRLKADLSARLAASGVEPPVY